MPDRHFTSRPGLRCGRIHRPRSGSSKVQVSVLAEQSPVGELLAEGEASVLGEAEHVELRVVFELRAAFLREVLPDVAQILGLQELRYLVDAGGSVGRLLHETTLPR